MFASRATGWLVLVCAFLAGGCAYALVVWGSYAADFGHRDIGKFVGRTTLMESVGKPVTGQPDYYKRRLADLEHLATSQRVLAGAAQMLSDLGVQPKEALTHTSVAPVKDTNILAIEVTLPDAKDAKVAADVIAAEVRKVYADQHADDAEEGFALRTIDPAFVHPVERPSIADFMSGFTARLAGPGMGIVFGLAAGIPLGLLIRRRKRTSPPQGA